MWFMLCVSSSLTLQCNKLKREAKCLDVGVHPESKCEAGAVPGSPKFKSPEEVVLMCLFKCNYDEDRARAMLDGLQASPEVPFTDAEASEFSRLMIASQKNFSSVASQMNPRRSVSELLDYYYKTWKGGRQYIIMKRQCSTAAKV